MAAQEWTGLNNYMRWLDGKLREEIRDDGGMLKCTSSINRRCKFDRLQVVLLWRIERRLKRIEEALATPDRQGSH